MENNYYVYEILIDDKVIYVGISNVRDEKYNIDDYKHYRRLQAHGYYCEKITAKRRLETDKLGRFKREILEAKVNDKKLSFNIVKNYVSLEEALAEEDRLITLYKPAEYDYIEVGDGLYKKVLVEGQLINKINSPVTLPSEKTEKWHGERYNNTKKKSWWNSLSEEEKIEYSNLRKEYAKKFKEEYPERYEANIKKSRERGKINSLRENLSEETLKKMSDNMKKRWARGEDWIEKKNKLSSKLMKELNQDPEFQEANRQRLILRNKDPEFQLKRVANLYKAIVNNNKSLEKWHDSYLELTKEGLYPKKSYRDWKKYFNSLEEVEKFVYENCK